MPDFPGTDAAPGARVEISREEVAHLATLARIDLDDAELDHLAPQLSVILESVASITGVAGDDVMKNFTKYNNLYYESTGRPVVGGG